MMLPTHALVGMALALPVALVAPEFAGVAFVSGLFGGVFPDFDLYVGHRKSLHYPVYYAALTALAVPFAVAAPSVLAVGATCLLAGAAAHSVADIFGGGLELRPWEANSKRAVYDHYNGRWLAPRRWIRYDGSTGDLLLSGAIAVPLLLAFDGHRRGVVVATLAVALCYTAVRRALPSVAERMVSRLHGDDRWEPVLPHLPTRYRPSGGAGHERSASEPPEVPDTVDGPKTPESPEMPAGRGPPVAESRGRPSRRRRSVAVDD